MLVVENEWLIASAIQVALKEVGASVLGPATSVSQALMLISQASKIDGAVLDIHLSRKTDGYPVAQILRDRSIPFVFATGYDAHSIRHDFSDIVNITKPFNANVIGHVLAAVSILGRHRPQA